MVWAPILFFVMVVNVGFIKNVVIRWIKNFFFKCAQCLSTARPVDGRKFTEVQLGNDKLGVVTDFCYLGDMLSAGGGCKLSSIIRIKCAWSKFHQLLPLFTNTHISFATKGQIYVAYVKADLLYSSETLILLTPSLIHLKRNDLAMIKSTCRVELVDRINTKALLDKLCIENIVKVIRCNKLR